MAARERAVEVRRRLLHLRIHGPVLADAPREHAAAGSVQQLRGTDANHSRDCERVLRQYQPSLHTSEEHLVHLHGTADQPNCGTARADQNLVAQHFPSASDPSCQPEGGEPLPPPYAGQHRP